MIVSTEQSCLQGRNLVSLSDGVPQEEGIQGLQNESHTFVKKNDGRFLIISSNICQANFSLKEVFFWGTLYVLPEEAFVPPDAIFNLVKMTSVFVK